MNRLYEYMNRQLATVPTSFHRYKYDEINWNNHMLGLVGPRGVGKTTLFLQRIKEEHSPEEALYVSAENMFFANNTLIDLADAFCKQGGRFLFIDEVHKYSGWSRELKIIYDSFPNLHIYFTGSSVLDIEKGEADLSRRAPRYEMQGLSFREYLAIRHGIDSKPFSLEEIIQNKAHVPGVEHPLPLFSDYLRCGYYPFGVDADFDIELNQVISRTLEVDIPLYANMSPATGRKLKKLMAVVSTLVPFKPNMTQLASQIGASRNNVDEYLMFMEKAGMTAQLRTGARGIGGLGKAEKIYLDNTNIIFNLSEGAEDIGTIRETFFLNQMRAKNSVTASAVSDFSIGDCTFEVGGKSKGRSQLSGVENDYVVKDNIEYGSPGVVPLWAFGLNY